MNEIKNWVSNYWWLDNSYPINITYEGITFPSVTHAFFASQTRDANLRTEMAFSRLDQLREFEQYIRTPYAGWLQIKVMKDLLERKFGYEKPLYQNDPEVDGLLIKLMATGKSDIIYGNWHHGNFWGACHCQNCQNLVGKNILGGLIKGVRGNLHKAIIATNNLDIACICNRTPEAWFLYIREGKPRLKPFCELCAARAATFTSKLASGSIARFEVDKKEPERPPVQRMHMRRSDLDNIREHFSDNQQVMNPFAFSGPMGSYRGYSTEPERKFESKLFKLSGRLS